MNVLQTAKESPAKLLSTCFSVTSSLIATLSHHHRHHHGHSAQ